MKDRTKIVLDADVIIHFSKGGHLKILPEIFPEYDFIVLSKVYEELELQLKKELNNIIKFFKSISIIDFNPSDDILHEYSQLIKRFGKGESSCMAYCRYTKDVVGSSNLKDIAEYCDKNNITHLGTMDFLYYAIWREKLTLEQVNDFVTEVKAKGSKLPDIDFENYHPVQKIDLPYLRDYCGLSERRYAPDR
ncbi:MAG: hypothetical protein PUK70_09450 [Bacteroidales bacterium]|nr:hypothetical protein [Bacteroidales bacterium]MDY6002442.1 hypothetical protein [Candidatus Cryptobacteroides sp.]